MATGGEESDNISRQRCLEVGAKKSEARRRERNAQNETQNTEEEEKNTERNTEQNREQKTATKALSDTRLPRLGACNCLSLSDGPISLASPKDNYLLPTTTHGYKKSV